MLTHGIATDRDLAKLVGERREERERRRAGPAPTMLEPYQVTAGGQWSARAGSALATFYFLVDFLVMHRHCYTCQRCLLNGVSLAFI
jgi:hypothetical protein